MELIELTLDSSLAFQTSNNGYLPTDTPRFSLGNGIRNVIGAKVVECSIPLSNYLWTTSIERGSGAPMNQLIFQSTTVNPADTSQRITIPPGNHTGSQLASILTTILQSSAFNDLINNLVSDIVTLSDVSVVYKQSTGKFTWTFALGPYAFPPPNYPDIFIRFFGNPNFKNTAGVVLAAQMLGLKQGNNQFNRIYDGKLRYTLTSGYAMVSGPTYITINSIQLGPLLKASPNTDITAGDNNYQFSSNGYSTPSLESIPLNVPQGAILTWQDPLKGEPYPIQQQYQLQTLDLYLTLGPYEKTPISLNGLPWTVKIKLLTSTPELTSLTPT